MTTTTRTLRNVALGGLTLATALTLMNMADEKPKRTPADVEASMTGYCAAQGKIPHAWIERDTDNQLNVYARCVTITEDDPRWDCHTMGNRTCGTTVPTVTCPAEPPNTLATGPAEAARIGCTP